MAFEKKNRFAAEVEESVKKTEGKVSTGEKKEYQANPDYLNDVFTIMRTKDGEKVFLSLNPNFKGEITVNGRSIDKVYTEHPFDRLERLVSDGKISEAVAQERAEKVPDTILGNVTVKLA